MPPVEECHDIHHEVFYIIKMITLPPDTYAPLLITYCQIRYQIFKIYKPSNTYV